MDNTVFEKLIRRSGSYSRHYLIHLYDSGSNINMYYVNDNADCTYDGHTYTAGSFKYTPNGSDNGFDGGGKLEISVKDNSVIDLVETYRSIYLDVVACINEDGTVTKITGHSHHYGTVTGNRKTVSFDFAKDDRQEMTFPTLIWSNINNRGNS